MASLRKPFSQLPPPIDEQADEILEMVDVLAETLRKLGQGTIRSIGHISRLQNIEDNDASYVEREKMLLFLMNDNKDLAARMRSIHQICSDHNDVSTTSILEVFIDETEKRNLVLV